jgi:site-specific recombinase XerD
MTPEQKLTDLVQTEAITPRRFDPRSAAPFVNKSVSEETRRAYRRAVADFFLFVGGKHPAEVVPADVINWRDHLRHGRKRAATVSFKLSVTRFFSSLTRRSKSLSKGTHLRISMVKGIRVYLLF